MTMPDRDGARGGGIRNAPSRSGPFELESPPAARWRKSPWLSAAWLCDPPTFQPCDIGVIVFAGPWDPSCDGSGCDGVGSYPNLGRLCRPGERFAGDLMPRFSFSFGS